EQPSKTGSTRKQIAVERDAEWKSNREEKNPSPRSILKSRIKAALKKKDQHRIVGPAVAAATVPEPGNGNRSGRPTIRSLPSAKPRFVEPMKARLVDEPPTHGDWLYELKFDGIRAIAVKKENKISLISRNGNKLDTRFPEIAKAVKSLPVR